MDDEITYRDVLEYQNLFMLVPSFVMERMAKRNSNLVLKFKSTIESHMASLNDEQKNKLKINTKVMNLNIVKMEKLLKKY